MSRAIPEEKRLGPPAPKEARQDGSGGRHTPCHDVIVIGGSAGALSPLQRIMADLPPNLPASVFVVLHVGGNSQLAEVLRHHSRLPVHRAENGAAVKPGHAYIAVPGCHLLIHDRHILLRHGPRENLARPAIDPLFRSAACTFGARVIGVVLSGALDDGTAGMRAIKRCGGVAVVQHPADATFQDMPVGVLRHVAVDHMVPAREIGPLLTRLAHEPAGETPDIPFDIRLETAIVAQELGSMEANQRLGQPSHFTCPECHGVLWEIDDGDLLRYRCHVGHAFTAEAVRSDQDRRMEELLWNLLRNHQERAALVGRMADKEQALRHDELAEKLRHRAKSYDDDAEIIRRLLHGAGTNDPVSNQEDIP